MNDVEDPKLIFPIDKSACFTGHRPNKLGGYDENNPVAREAKTGLSSMIEVAKESGYRFFISGMALGIDIWAAEMVLSDSDLTLIAAVPCPEQSRLWRAKDKERHAKILALAHGTVTVDTVYSPKAMHLRNHWMVDRSSLVLAVFDGSKDGGTAACLRYALKKNKEIICFNPFTSEVSELSSL